MLPPNSSLFSACCSASLGIRATRSRSSICASLDFFFACSSSQGVIQARASRCRCARSDSALQRREGLVMISQHDESSWRSQFPMPGSKHGALPGREVTRRTDRHVEKMQGGKGKRLGGTRLPLHLLKKAAAASPRAVPGAPLGGALLQLPIQRLLLLIRRQVLFLGALLHLQPRAIKPLFVRAS